MPAAFAPATVCVEPITDSQEPLDRHRRALGGQLVHRSLRLARHTVGWVPDSALDCTDEGAIAGRDATIGRQRGVGVGRDPHGPGRHGIRRLCQVRGPHVGAIPLDDGSSAVRL
jgi:hypothetical protein